MDFTQEDINEIRDKNFPEWRWRQIQEDRKRDEENRTGHMQEGAPK